MLKKIFFIIALFLFSVSSSFAGYHLETGSQKFVEKYKISTQNLDKEISRKEFVETLYKWYVDYKKDRGVTIDYDNYNKIQDENIFKDIDLDSEFGKKLSYFADKGVFAKNQYFSPKDTMSQKTFFIVMKRLKIMFGLQNCKYHKICEREADEKTKFLKGSYLKYVSKIMDRSLRKYYSTSQGYIDAGYKPLLSPNYNFPLKGQTLNGCYAFSLRNILKYNHGIGVYVPKIETAIGKEPTKLWNYPMMSKFDEYVHVETRSFYNIDTLIASLQAGEPLVISYMLEYYSYKHKEYKTVAHLVAAYSFDENGIWVSETVANQRKLVPWEEVFGANGRVKLNRIFKVDYNPKRNWTQEAINKENTENYLVGE